MEIKKYKKKITFDYMRDVMYVPEKEEYIRNGVWWDELDYIEFQNSAIQEVMPLIKKYGKITLHKALLILYNTTNTYFTKSQKPIVLLDI